LLLMVVVTIAVMLILAFANGANDVSKGIATLVGSGISSYRRAVLWGSVCTVAGALAAGVASQRLVATFSGQGILVRPSPAPAFLLAIGIGAIMWLVIATRTGLPVSTTHSLAGALVGATMVIEGPDGIIWTALTTRILLPLLASPIVSVILLMAIVPLMRPLVARFDRYCLCLEQRETVAITPGGISFRQPASTFELAPQEECSTKVVRFSAIDTVHWISAGTTSFFRGVNDTPKILAVGIAAAAISNLTATSIYALLAFAMGMGGLVAGFRVTRTLADRITPLAPANGFAANVVTSVLVGLASRAALPVSTTHVSSGAILGVGLWSGARQVQWKTVAEMLLAWVVTLPVSGALAAGAAIALAH
jgi:PiT family inorganic phosphate transporter